MKLDLSSDDMATLLNLLDPFSHPALWEDEELDRLKIRIERQLIKDYAFCLKESNGKNVFYPGEWSVTKVKEYLMSHENEVCNPEILW
jgi:hypothetical protein